MILHSPHDFRKVIRSARKAQGLTQRELASECACGTRFISELENGKPTIELGRALRVANTLSLDLAIQARGE